MAILTHNRKRYIAVLFYLMGKFFHRLGKDVADIGDWILYGYSNALKGNVDNPNK